MEMGPPVTMHIPPVTVQPQVPMGMPPEGSFIELRNANPEYVYTLYIW